MLVIHGTYLNIHVMRVKVTAPIRERSPTHQLANVVKRRWYYMKEPFSPLQPSFFSLLEKFFIHLPSLYISTTFSSCPPLWQEASLFIILMHIHPCEAARRPSPHTTRPAILSFSHSDSTFWRYERHKMAS